MRCKLTIFSLVICESFRNPLSQIREKRNGSNEDKSSRIYICIFPDWSFAVHSHDRGEVPGWQTDGRVIDIGAPLSLSLYESTEQRQRTCTCLVFHVINIRVNPGERAQFAVCIHWKTYHRFPFHFSTWNFHSNKLGSDNNNCVHGLISMSRNNF